jgi:hypothetical protein
VSLEITVDATTAATLNGWLQARLAKAADGSEESGTILSSSKDRPLIPRGSPAFMKTLLDAMP